MSVNIIRVTRARESFGNDCDTWARPHGACAGVQLEGAEAKGGGA